MQTTPRSTSAMRLENSWKKFAESSNMSSKVVESRDLHTSVSPTDLQISLCISSSVISEANACNLEHITHIAYQIAKAATIFRVSEIVTLDVPRISDRFGQLTHSGHGMTISGEGGNKKITFNSSEEEKLQSAQQNTQGSVNSIASTGKDNDALLLASLLQFFITPKYLVKSVFRANPYKKKFGYAEKLPTLTCLPFMRNDDLKKTFKEGFTVSKRAPLVRKKNKKSSAAKKLRVTKYVNVGGPELLELIGPEVPTNVRVTVDLKNKRVVSPDSAYGNAGSKAPFGYCVRLAKSITSVFTESNHPEGYTESVLVNADNYFGKASELQIPIKENQWKGRTLIMIGNLRDLNSVFKKESVEGVDDIADMFDAQLSVPSGLRTEDAVLVSLSKI